MARNTISGNANGTTTIARTSRRAGMRAASNNASPTPATSSSARLTSGMTMLPAVACQNSRSRQSARKFSTLGTAPLRGSVNASRTADSIG